MAARTTRSLDEVRIWNTVRSSNEIAINFNREIKTNAPGLIARWALNDATGLTATNSIGGEVAGVLTNGPVWAAGYPFPTPVDLPPATPSPNAPANNASNILANATLDVTVSDPDSSPLTVTYHGRVAGTAAPGADFTFVALPDTQFYSSSLNGGLPAMFTNQTHWIITNRVSQNIQYVAQLGDCVQNGDNGGNNVEWLVATNAMYKLENPATTFLPEGVPYGIAVGNHDQSPIASATGTTTFYNQFFGTNHFAGYNYYGDHYGTNNDNHFDLFSASGMDFIVVFFEYDAAMTTNSPAIVWANNVLQTHANRRAVVVSHWIINAGSNATFGAQGQAIYDGLKGNTNLFLMLSGHVSPPEGQRTDTFQGRTVWSVMSDYQGRANGGSGWLRYYEFSPSNNVIRAKTFSPVLNQFETDADSQFEIPYQMSASNPFTPLGTNSNVPSGNNTSLVWSNLTPGVQYEWYATVSDGNSTVTGPVQKFTVGTAPPANTPPVISVIANQVINEDGVTGPLAFTIGDLETAAASLQLSSTSSVPVLVPPAGIVFGGAGSNRTATVTPAANLSGTNLITLFVSDGTNTASTSFELAVLAVNDAPVAGADAVLRWASQAVATPVATLLTNDTDIEGNLLSLLSVTGATPPGANVNLSNNVVTYRSAFGDTNAGAFKYIITDGNGGSATGAVAVAVQPDPVGVDALSVVRSGATLKLMLTGVPGFTYTVQTSPALAPPTWTNLAVVVADGLGQIALTNTPTDPRRFFRSVRGSAP